jgi:hypothetical protein
MTKDEALKLALDALDNLLYWDNGKSDYDQAREAITAIKQATAQPAPVQPVSGVVLRDGYPTLIQDKHIKETDHRLCILPTTPAAQPAPMQDLPFGVGGGLVAIKTLLSRDPCVHANTAIEMIDAILKEHRAAQPVAWVGLSDAQNTVIWANSQSIDEAIRATEKQLMENNI